MLVFGTGVRVGHFNPALFDALEHASIASLLEGFDVYVISLNDKTHGANTLHVYDFAADLGVAGNDRAKIERLFSRLTRALSSDYDVIFEENHVHVEYDMRRPTKDAPPPKA